MADRTTAVYLRCSTIHQKTDSQRVAIQTWLKNSQIELYEEFEDLAYSGSTTKRPALDRLMEGIKTDRFNRVVIFSLSRIARSTKFLLEIADILNERGVALVSITESIDTKTPAGKCFFTILGTIAELEKEMIRGRVISGLEKARMQGKVLGRKKTHDSSAIRSLRKQGLTYREIARAMKCSIGTVSIELRRTGQ